MLNITRQISKYNHYKGNDIKYIVLHYVGATGTAKNNADYFCGGDRQASAHYFVDDNSIYQVVEDFNGSWAVGNTKTEVNNKNSINIEMCCPNPQLLISEKTEQNTIELVQYLMKKYNVPITNIRTHYEVSGKTKVCPNWSANNWDRWTKFKDKLAGNSSSNTGVNNLTPAKNDMYRVRKSWGDVKSQIGAYSVLENAIAECKKHNGYSVFNNNGEVVYPVVNTSTFDKETITKTYAENGKATVVVNKLNVRDLPHSTKGNKVAEYIKNESFYYHTVHISECYVWVEYLSNSGHKRYVAVKNKTTGERYANCV